MQWSKLSNKEYGAYTAELRDIHGQYITAKLTLIKT